MFASRVESRLKEFPFLWQVKRAGDPWSSADTIKVKRLTPDLLRRNIGHDRTWWAYLERTDSEVNSVALKVVEIDWFAGSFAEAIHAVVKHWGEVKYLVSSERSQLAANYPLYTVWRVPTKM